MEASLPYTASMYKSHIEGKLSQNGALFFIQLLYTTHIEKVDSLSDWRSPLSYTASIYNSYREGRLYQNGGHHVYKRGKAYELYTEDKAHELYLEAV